jgi:hypothetical protein
MQDDIHLRQGSHSDNWYPYVMGAAHPLRDHVRMFDNIELALCHTPRLNAFLGEVADATRAAGGVFQLFRDETLDPGFHPRASCRPRHLTPSGSERARHTRSVSRTHNATLV